MWLNKITLIFVLTLIVAKASADVKKKLDANQEIRDKRCRKYYLGSLGEHRNQAFYTFQYSPSFRLSLSRTKNALQLPTPETGHVIRVPNAKIKEDQLMEIALLGKLAFLSLSILTIKT